MELSGYPMTALRILFGGGFTVAACLGIGARVLGGAGKDWAVRFVVGAAVLSLIMFALCCLGWVYWPVMAGVGAAAIALGCPWRRPVRVCAIGVYRVLFLIFAFYFVVYFFNAMAPEVSPDGATYHLGLVSHFLREHGFRPVTWNMYASMPEGMEMLFLFAFAFGRHSAAAMVHFAFLVALVWQISDYGRRAGYPVAGACAAMLVFCSPLAGIDGTSAYNDVALAAVAFTLFNLLQRWGLENSGRVLAAIGAVAGFAFAVKYTGWPAVVYAGGYVAYKSRSWRKLAVVSSSAAVMILPWLVKNWMWIGNPLAPFFNHWFPNPYVTAAFEAGYKQDMAMYDLSSRWQIPMQVTVHGGLGGLLGPVFLLAPIALLALRKPIGRQLLLAAVVFGINYFSNISPRFLLSSLPFVALAMGVSLSAVPAVLVALTLVHAVISWPTAIPRYAEPNSWHLTETPWRAALRIKPEEDYLAVHLFFWEELEMLNRATPPHAAVFTFRPIAEAYTNRKILVQYESEPNQIAGHLLQTAYDPKLQPTWQVRLRFPRQELEGIRLVQRMAGRQQWNIHELRIFDGPVEVPRQSSWRIDARPYPFGIGYAFDNSLLTFWESGELLAPGQTVEVDFGGAATADSVVMQAEPDLSDLRLELMGRLKSGWVPLASGGEISENPPPEGLRCAASRELKRRGVDYVLAWNDEPQTADLRRDTRGWCAAEVAETQNARLYRLP